MSPPSSPTSASPLRLFPSSITLSDSAALEYVLADIPFFAVGLLGFGVFKFFFAMRRISRLSIFVHVSVFIAFLASVLDLSQILRRGSYNTDHGIEISSVAAFIIVRELGFAFSIGFRFLVFWFFVAEPPRGELPPLPIPDERRPNFITLDSQSVIHSGSWVKWGFLGVLLKWSLLVMSVSIPILQSIWRLASQFTRFGPVYNVEGTLEIVVSALFIIKLLANTWLCPLMPRWRTLRDYSPVLLALSISMGLGIGNILCFEFSESSLGRFLQAVELYILILFVLISAFYKMPVRSSVVAELVRRRLASTPFEGLREGDMGSSFRVSPPNVSTPELIQAGDLTVPSEPSRPSLGTRLSTTSKLSSWIMARRTSGRGDAERDERLWDQSEAERGQSPTDQKSVRGPSFDNPSTSPKEEANWKDPVYTSVVPAESSEARNVKSPRVPPPIAVSPSNTNMPIAPSSLVRADSMMTTSRTIPSTYSVQTRRPASYSRPPTRAETDRSMDSPVYGLDGIIGRQRQMDGVDTQQADDKSIRSSVGMEDLLQQQQELDRSIAGLRLFSSEVRGSRLTPRAVSRLESASMRSEFSLSNFPEPPFYRRSNSIPISTTPSPADSSQIVPAPERDSEGDFVVDDTMFQLVPPQPSAMAGDSSRIISLPMTDRDSDQSLLGARGARLDSQGTQYDVTSFIGNLTSPPRYYRESPLSQVSESAALSDDEAPATIIDARLVTDTRGPPVLDPLPYQVDGTGVYSPGASSLAVADAVPRAFKPLGLSAGVRTAATAAGVGKGKSRLRPQISNPMLIPSSTMDERGAFVRPRPAPSAQNANDLGSPSDGRFF